MFLFIALNTFPACVGITIHAEVAASVVYTDILANHAATHLTLSLVLHSLESLASMGGNSPNMSRFDKDLVTL